MEERTAQAFWSFSCGLYRQPKVQSALLRLQRRHGININVILWCLWLGVSGYRRLTLSQMQECLDHVYLWHDRIVCGLRLLRQHIPKRDGRRVLRDMVLDYEVEAERIEQSFLVARMVWFKRVQVGSSRTQCQRACHHLATYFQAMGVCIGRRNQADLMSVLQALFNTLSADWVQQTGASVWQRSTTYRPRQMALSLLAVKSK